LRLPTFRFKLSYHLQLSNSKRSCTTNLGRITSQKTKGPNYTLSRNPTSRTDAAPSRMFPLHITQNHGRFVASHDLPSHIALRHVSAAPLSCRKASSSEMISWPDGQNVTCGPTKSLPVNVVDPSGRRTVDDIRTGDGKALRRPVANSWLDERGDGVGRGGVMGGGWGDTCWCNITADTERQNFASQWEKDEDWTGTYWNIPPAIIYRPQTHNFHHSNNSLKMMDCTNYRDRVYICGQYVKLSRWQDPQLAACGLGVAFDRQTANSGHYSTRHNGTNLSPTERETGRTMGKRFWTCQSSRDVNNDSSLTMHHR
jgi:hypothetical protein